RWTEGIRSSREHITGDSAESRTNTGHRCCHIKGSKAVTLQTLGTGDQHKRPQVGSAKRGEIAAGGTRKRKGERSPLVKKQELPVLIKWGTQPLPAQRPQLGSFDTELDREPILALHA